MKINNLSQIIENTISKEIKRAILEKSETKDYYHVMVDNLPVETFENENEAKQYVMNNKKKHGGKELLIDKKKYNSYDEMIDALDEMGEKLEQTENINMKKKLKENFMDSDVYDDDMQAMSPHDKYTMSGNQDDAETVEMSEDFDERVISKYLGSEDNGNETDVTEQMPYSPKRQFKIDLVKDPDYIESMAKRNQEKNKYGPMPNSVDNDTFVTSHYKYNVVDDEYEEDDELFEDMTTGMCSECGGMLNEEGACGECVKAMDEGSNMCSECGTMLNEEGMCSECSDSKMYESKKKKLILKERDLVKLIQKMVAESIPGSIAANKSREDSGKENKKYYDEVGKKMKDYLTFDGNDNPEFPHQIGKGEKVARQNTSEQDDEVEKNFAGLQNLEYDIEPSEKFKERLKMAINGDSKMGNGVLSKQSKTKLSNDASIGKESEQKTGNHIVTKTGEKLEKQMLNRKKDKEKRRIYKKENVPVNTSNTKDDGINENKIPNVILEEINKIKRITNYDKRTQ